MKDKLRDLAERWKGAGCRNGSSHECADELLSILDAEGEDVAVGEFVGVLHVVADQTSQYGVSASFGYSDNCGGLAVGDHNCYTHPARSGVVRDEDVSVVSKMIADKCGNGMREKYEELAKQIAEHFAAIAQEKQS